MTAQELTDMTTHIVATLKQQQIPAVGFVNENKLYMHVGKSTPASPRSINGSTPVSNSAITPSRTPRSTKSPQGFEESVIRGETVTKTLLAQHGKTIATSATRSSTCRDLSDAPRTRSLPHRTRLSHRNPLRSIPKTGLSRLFTTRPNAPATLLFSSKLPLHISNSPTTCSTTTNILPRSTWL